MSDKIERDILEVEIKKIRYRAKELQCQLKGLNILDGKIVNFGCANGYETFALMLAFDTNKVVGLDRNKVGEQQNYFLEVKEFCQEYSQALLRGEVSQIDPIWWNDQVPSFLKDGLYPIFIEADITQPLPNLPFEDFDLAYCSNVLYIIEEEYSTQGVKSAIETMAQLLKSGGFIVADEPIDTNLEPIFREIKSIESYKLKESDRSPKYLYKKL